MGEAVCRYVTIRTKSEHVMVCRLDSLSLSLNLLVDSVIFVGFMMLVEEDGWARGGVRARGMDEGT